ncbi:hypothetical protein HJB78_26800 [Rhizobium lentis]|uniref:hypothetical protein n=1 Tax=Rhizobium lentis TaxID=1138194 RepID=UPI001C834FF0|nr:hypothetical protein [Rhizobium lentis]MBX5154530.1 hypothetical protein [Rhizobium lentis]
MAPPDGADDSGGEGAGRLNRIRDEYVRRSDLDGRVHRLESSIKDLREEHRETSKETTRRLDAIIASLAKNNA